MKNIPQNKGFVALITALMVAASLMLVVLSRSQSLSVIFDEINRKQYRIMATEAALSCLHRVVIGLEHDYFYTVGAAGDAAFGLGAVSYPDLRCTIVSVVSASSNNIDSPTPMRLIKVEGYSGVGSTTPGSITATVAAQVLINFQNISLVSETTTF